MNYQRTDLELDYNTLLLNHLDRISHLSSYIPGQQVMAGGSMIRNSIQDKRQAMHSAIGILEAFIPDTIKDKEFRQALDNLKEKEDDKHPTNRNLLKILINLMERKGLLFRKNMIIEDG